MGRTKSLPKGAIATTPEETAESALSRLFESHFKAHPGEPVPLKGDGSPRRLWRLKSGDTSAIGAFNADHKENRAFIGLCRHFRKISLPVPEIYAWVPERNIYLEEDLGDTTLFEFLVATRDGEKIKPKTLDLYRRAARRLAEFQINGIQDLDESLLYPRPIFDKQSILWDCNHFKYYFLQLAKITFDEQALEEDFSRFADFLLGAPAAFFVYRDFQSRNIMIRDGELCFIDFQGGRRGALQYDIASLLYDAKADLPFAFRDELLEIYMGAAGRLVRLDRKQFMTYYPAFVYVRIMQAMGAYGIRGFHERKSHFLQSIPYAIRNLEYLMRTATLPVKLPALLGVFRSLTGSSLLRQYGRASLRLTVRIASFSYRLGPPQDNTGHGGGYVFDCRALPNPGRFEKYAELTGRDAPVAAFLDNEPAVEKFLQGIYGLVSHSVENYRTRNFTDLMVTFGCTGGRHRSVYCAERLSRFLRDRFPIEVELRHLALEKTKI